MQRSHRIGEALWPALLLAVLVFVVLDFAQHPPLGATSDAAPPPAPRWTLWLAQTEAGEEAGAVVREAADSLLLYGRPGGVGVLPGGASQAVNAFFERHGPSGELLAVSSETLAELAQERTSTLFGEDPLRAARAQGLLAGAMPVGVLSEDRLAIAVSPSSPVHSVEQLLGELRRASQSHVFAIVNSSWAADILAALVNDAGVEGVVPYRVFPSTSEAALALAAGGADVILAPRGAIAPEARARRLRELEWPAAAGPVPRAWVELLAPPGEAPARVRMLRRQLAALRHNAVWRRVLGEQAPAHPLSGSYLHGFLSAQMALATRLQQAALRVERH